MRVLHILGTGQPGGVESFVLQLVRDTSSDDASFAVAIVGEDGPVANQLRDAGAAIVTRGAREMYRLLATRRFDIVHANSGGRRARLASRAAGARVMSHLHGLEAGWLTDGVVNRRDLGGHLKSLGTGADLIAVSSRWMFDLVHEGGASPPLVILPYGVDTVRFSPGVRAAFRLAARERLGIPASAPVIGFAGRLVPQKGIEHLVAIARAFQQDDVAVVVVGAGPDLGVLEAGIAQGLANVHLAGPTLDMPAMMASFDVTVIPSRWEPFGIVALESAAMGIPVVAFDAGGLPEAIADGETGILVPGGDADALAAAVRRIFSDPHLAERLGAAGRERVARDFSSHSSSHNVLERYRELMRMRRGG